MQPGAAIPTPRVIRELVFLVLPSLWIACSLAKPPASVPQSRTQTQVFESDTTRSSAHGVSYTIPAGWALTTRERIAIVSAPERDLHVALVETDSTSLDAAISDAWQRYGQAPPVRKRVVQSVRTGGWERSRAYVYELPPEDRRVVVAEMRWHGDHAVVLLLDAADATREKRSGQFALLDESIHPAGYSRGPQVDRTAKSLRGERLGKLDAFVEHALHELGIPGAAIAVAEGQEVLLARGYGVRELGKPAAVDSETLFRIASNTKALTSFLLARLVDAGVMRWEQPVSELYPEFALGDPNTTASTQLEHLLCSCTGLPRSDLQRLFEFGSATPEFIMGGLSRVRPTTAFGEAFQYSNELSAAAGFVAARALWPSLPLGEGYDRAMQQWVFDPLCMPSTTFDYALALKGNHATGHTWSIPGRGATEIIDPLGLDRATLPIRPAGGAWSTVNDLIRYLQLELGGGVTPDGARLVSESNLLRRRARYAMMAKDEHYGIGLVVDNSSGTPVIGHEGYTFGYYSRLLWLPKHGVGVALLANADAGNLLGEALEGYLLELLFDTAPTAQERMRGRADATRKDLSDLLADIAIPATPDASRSLAARYFNPSLGRLEVQREGSATKFNFGEWKTEVASRLRADGSLTFQTITPGFDIFEFAADKTADGKRRLTLRDNQHEYAFVEIP